MAMMTEYLRRYKIDINWVSQDMLVNADFTDNNSGDTAEQIQFMRDTRVPGPDVLTIWLVNSIIGGTTSAVRTSPARSNFDPNFIKTVFLQTRLACF